MSRPDPYLILPSLESQKPVFERLVDLGYSYRGADYGDSAAKAWAARVYRWEQDARPVLCVEMSTGEMWFMRAGHSAFNKMTRLNSPAHLYVYLAMDKASEKVSKDNW